MSQLPAEMTATGQPLVETTTAGQFLGGMTATVRLLDLVLVVVVVMPLGGTMVIMRLLDMVLMQVLIDH